MAYSESYNFKNTQVIRLIEDAYRLIYKIPNPISAEDLFSATFSLNLLLSSWANKGLNLWAVSRNNLLTLNPNQIQYDLPQNIIDILEVSTRTFNRSLGGTAFSSEGTAANAFDGDPDTACTQTSINGHIGYDYGEDNTENPIQMFGLTSEVNRSYTLSIQYSSDNISWTTFYSVPLTAFIADKVQWFNIETPASSRYFRILETGGAVLNINEIYFNNQIEDIVVTPEARANYMTYPSKYETGRPTTYVFNKQLATPSITVWPAATEEYPALLYNCTLQIQDVGALSNSIFIPVNFYMAIRDGLGYELAKKSGNAISDSKLMLLKEDFKESFNLAAKENTEKYIPLKINFDMTRYIS